MDTNGGVNPFHAKLSSYEIRPKLLLKVVIKKSHRASNVTSVTSSLPSVSGSSSPFNNR